MAATPILRGRLVVSVQASELEVSGSIPGIGKGISVPKTLSFVSFAAWHENSAPSFGSRR